MVNSLAPTTPAGPGGPSTKALLLSRLRDRRGCGVSGQELADEAGVSRVAVWKAAEALRAAGYAVGSTGQGGYVLEEEGDYLYPWEFPGREHLFRHWAETDSTMERAREMAERGVAGGAVAVAERQTAGRGRSGRTWASPEGGLFFTLLERPDLPVADHGRLSILAQLAAAAAIGDATGSEVKTRWPNDLYIRGRKIAGVLTELRGEGDRLTWVTVGVGINVNNAPGLAGAISCKDLAGQLLSRRNLLAAFLARMEELRREASNPRELAARWNALVEGKGGRFALIPGDHGGSGESRRAAVGRSLGAGTFLGIDRYGRAVVDTTRGTRSYAPGAASLVPVQTH